MVWPGGGLQHSDGAGNLVFAAHLNTKAMQERGNKVISDCIVTEQSPTPDLTVEVASGNVIANGIVVAVSAADPFSGTPATFATTQGLLTSGQAEFVAVHVDSSGTITNTEGGAATAGQQTPPEVPEDEVLLAMITLTFGDSTINTATDIEDWRQFVPDGQYIAGSLELTGGIKIGANTLTTIEWANLDGFDVLATNVLDKTAAEIITGAWIIDNATGLTFNNQGAGGDPILSSNDDAQLLDLTGSLNISSNLAVDTINEYTGGVGITLDGVLLKDTQVRNIVVKTFADEWEIIAGTCTYVNAAGSGLSYLNLISASDDVRVKRSVMVPTGFNRIRFRAVAENNSPGNTVLELRYSEDGGAYSILQVPWNCPTGASPQQMLSTVLTVTPGSYYRFKIDYTNNTYYTRVYNLEMIMYQV